MKKTIILLLLCAMALCLHAKESLRIGVAPHSSARIIYETHQDLKLFFEKHFNRPVDIVSAKSFSEFSKRSNEGTAYDLILTSPNLALLAKNLAQYEPLMTYTKGLETTILSIAPDVLSSAKRPLRVAGQDPVSFSTLSAQAWLESKGLVEGEDILYSYHTSASDSLAAILVSDQADLVIMSWPNYLNLGEDIKSKVTIFYHSPAAPSRIYLAKEGNGVSFKQWEEGLRAFAQSAEGAAHLEKTKLEGFKMIAKDALDGLGNLAYKTLKRLDVQP